MIWDISQSKTYDAYLLFYGTSGRAGGDRSDFNRSDRAAHRRAWCNGIFGRSYGNFDRLAFCALVKAKKRHPNIILYLLLAYLPKPGKVENLECFDGTLYFEGIERVPPRLAIVEMNRRMLEKSDYLISYVARDWGGAA